MTVEQMIHLLKHFPPNLTVIVDREYEEVTGLALEAIDLNGEPEAVSIRYGD